MSDETDSLDDQGADMEADYYLRLYGKPEAEPKIATKAWMHKRIARIVSEGTVYARLASLFVSQGITSMEARHYLKGYPEDIVFGTINSLRDYERTQLNRKTRPRKR